MSVLTPEDISICINSLVERNEIWKNKSVRIFYIINKTAGCFTNRIKAEHYKQAFSHATAECQKKTVLCKALESRIFITKYAGHAKELAQAVIAELIATNEKNTECILVTAGGDGTSLEVETALLLESQKEPKKYDAIKNEITILRLPLGTGNDGTDGHHISETIELLKSSIQFTNVPAIKVYPENPPSEIQLKNCKKNPKRYNPDNPQFPWYAFNIASMGLDAYVVYMTNTVKKNFPGNFYHLCVPISGIFYDKDFPTGTATMQFFDKNDNKTGEITTEITLIAFGASGNRVYGGGHKVLPNENNVCYAPKIKLLRLIKENKRFVDGSFVDTDIAYLKSAEKLRVYYDKPILLQCDGEVALLTKHHFPLIFEKTEPILRTLTFSNKLEGRK